MHRPDIEHRPEHPAADAARQDPDELDAGNRFEGVAAVRENGWRFASRRLHPAFRDPYQWGPMELRPDAERH